MNLVNAGGMHVLEVRVRATPRRAARCCRVVSCHRCLWLSLLQPVVARRVRVVVSVDATPDDDARRQVAVYRRGLVDVGARRRLLQNYIVTGTSVRRGDGWLAGWLAPVGPVRFGSAAV